MNSSWVWERTLQNRESWCYLLQEHKVVLKVQTYRNPVRRCQVNLDFCNMSTCTPSLLALKGKCPKISRYPGQRFWTSSNTAAHNRAKLGTWVSTKFTVFILDLQELVSKVYVPILKAKIRTKKKSFLLGHRLDCIWGRIQWICIFPWVANVSETVHLGTHSIEGMVHMQGIVLWRELRTTSVELKFFKCTKDGVYHPETFIMYVRSNYPWFLGLRGWSGHSWSTGKVAQPRSQVSTLSRTIGTPNSTPNPGHAGSPAPSSGFLECLFHFAELTISFHVLKALTSPNICPNFFTLLNMPLKSTLFVHDPQYPCSCCAWHWTLRLTEGFWVQGSPCLAPLCQLPYQLAHPWKNLWLFSHYQLLIFLHIPWAVPSKFSSINSLLAISEVSCNSTWVLIIAA